MSVATGNGALSPLNAADADAAAVTLQPCCASRRWVADVVAGRPYPSLDTLVRRSEETLGALSWEDVGEALAAHPRIGQRAAGDGREASWSRQEQSAASAATGDVLERLRAGNVAYEQRFGHVFLVCATGRTPEEILARLQERMGHEPAQERDVVRAELAAIVRLRLAKAFG